MGFLKCNLKMVLGIIGGAYIAQNYDVPNIKDEILKAFGRVEGTYMKRSRTREETSSTNPEPKIADSS